MSPSNVDFLGVYQKDGVSAAQDLIKVQRPSPDSLMDAAGTAILSGDVVLFDLAFANATSSMSMDVNAIGAMSHCPQVAIQMMEILQKYGWNVKEEGHFVLL
jgi:hypothetical protein